MRAASVSSCWGLRRGLRVVPAQPRTTDSPVGAGAAATELVAVLVRQVLVDLEAGRVEVAEALGLVATLAWRHGHDSAGERADPDPDPDTASLVGRGGNGDDDFVVVITDPATGEVDAQGPYPGLAACGVADRARVDLNDAGLFDFTVALAELRSPPRL